jgi:rhamnosyltransferase
MQVSILIRTKNEAAAIGKTLDLIKDQTVQPDDIIIVDSGSTDQTVEIIKSWQNSQLQNTKLHNIKLIEIPSAEFTYGKSLNIGFQAAQGDVVVSLSAHAFPKDNYWLENLVKSFTDSHVAATYGRQFPHLDAWPPVQREYLSYYGDKLKEQADPDNPADYCFSNSNSAIRRSVWEKQPFDETLSYAEDQAWAINILRLGYKIIYEPQASVYHSHNESLGKVYFRSYQEYRAYKQLYGGNLNPLKAGLEWYYLVKEDIKFILKSKSHFQWLVFSPIYRLFYILGKVRAFI